MGPITQAAKSGRLKKGEACGFAVFSKTKSQACLKKYRGKIFKSYYFKDEFYRC